MPQFTAVFINYGYNPKICCSHRYNAPPQVYCKLPDHSLRKQEYNASIEYSRAGESRTFHDDTPFP